MSAICHSSLFNSKRPLKESQGIMKKGYNGMGGHEKFLQSVSFCNYISIRNSNDNQLNYFLFDCKLMLTTTHRHPVPQVNI